MRLTRPQRLEIARARIERVLSRHGIATTRTLEQKISDAGPGGQRVDPHVLTDARRELLNARKIVSEEHAGGTWFRTHDADAEFVADRLRFQIGPYKELGNRRLSMRLGQTLEIATYRALEQIDEGEFYGSFRDLDEHDDSIQYKKEEPPQHIGKKRIEGGQNLDFIVRHPSAGYLGLECKNVREWIYPDRDEIKETISKCVSLNCVPVIIARRIPFVTFRILSRCGVIIHQTYNQLLPSADQYLAERARDKFCLGYHDIRVGNSPDKRLVKFITKDLYTVADACREKFDANKKLLSDFASERISYPTFSATVLGKKIEEEEWWNPADWGLDEE